MGFVGFTTLATLGVGGGGNGAVLMDKGGPLLLELEGPTVGGPLLPELGAPAGGEPLPSRLGFPSSVLSDCGVPPVSVMT